MDCKKKTKLWIYQINSSNVGNEKLEKNWKEKVVCIFQVLPMKNLIISRKISFIVLFFCTFQEEKGFLIIFVSCYGFSVPFDQQKPNLAVTILEGLHYGRCRQYRRLSVCRSFRVGSLLLYWQSLQFSGTGSLLLNSFFFFKFVKNF